MAIELLSPAGTLECGLAAFHYGADAVYLGMKEFSARADAGNFTPEDLDVLLGIAHRDADHRRSVYVAVNTLVRSGELEGLIGTLAHLQDAGVDGIIVQDGAVVQLCREYFPQLVLHASTQMAIHNVQGALAAREMGFRRIVAARELSMNELSALSAIPGLEIEAFIHGALCYSYSGLCLMSACFNGESGNRGSCTYVCRNKFKVTNETGKELGSCCPFSMKDLALGDLLPAMEKAGIASLKIEGRKKTPLYVASVTNYYRHLLDGTFRNEQELQAALDVKTVFSRPWTKLFAVNTRAAGVTDPHTVGPRGIEVGQVKRVRSVERGGEKLDYLRFALKTRPIEKHDGLQVELPTHEKPYGFGIDELWTFTQGGSDRAESVFVAQPGDTVEVPLPQGHPEFPVGARIFCTSSQEVKRRYDWPEARPTLDRQRRRVDFTLTVKPDGVVLQAVSDKARTRVELPAQLSPAQKPEKLEADCRQALERLGDTPFELGCMDVRNPQSLYLPKSLLNEARRNAANALQEAMVTQRGEEIAAIGEGVRVWRPVQSAGELGFSIKVDKAFFLDMLPLDSLEEVVFALDRTSESELDGCLERLQSLLGTRNRIRLSVPVVSRNVGFRDWSRTVARLVKAGWRRWELGNIGAWQMLKSSGVDVANLDITADWSLYAMNPCAARLWLDMGAGRVTSCPEDTMDNLLELGRILGTRLTALLYQDVVVGRSATCAMSSINGFCPGKPNCTFKTLTLTNGKGETLTAVNDNCMTVLLNAVPLDLCGMAPDLKTAGVRHFRADFLWRDYAPTQVSQLWKRVIHAAD